VLLGFDYSSHTEDIAICAAAECGSLLADGLGDGLALITSLSQKATQDLSFNILQAVRMRMTKTDYISCPGCGRTLFDLQNVAKNIREETAHLPGVKIAIMGCIVNGPGEMADADFGFVGSRPGMIDLYLGKECVEKGIVFADAVEKLIALIKAQGRWVDKVDLTVL
jgi:(E)-4-hydroxy-3-methylbut-2-enyl-diphosphate synthase